MLAKKEPKQTMGETTTEWHWEDFSFLLCFILFLLKKTNHKYFLTIQVKHITMKFEG